MPILTDFNSMFTSLRQGFDSRMASGTLTMDQVVQETHELTDRIAREQIQDYVQVLDERLRNSQLRKKTTPSNGAIKQKPSLLQPDLWSLAGRTFGIKRPITMCVWWIVFWALSPIRESAGN